MKAEESKRKLAGINIKAVSERTGVSLHTLRAWERRYGIPRPGRNANNRYRLYDEDDIADVLWMKRQVEQGISPAHASAQLRQMPRGISANLVPPTAKVEQLAGELYHALIARDEAAANRLLNNAWSALAAEVVVLDLIQPTMIRIGDGWMRNLLSVEQEHFASNLLRQHLHARIQQEPAPPLGAARLVAACAPDEQHDLGLLILTLLARQYGWQVVYLGQRTPLDDLDHASEHASYLILSVTTVTGLASLIPLWSRPLPRRVDVVWGGAA